MFVTFLKIFLKSKKMEIVYFGTLDRIIFAQLIQ